ncbi:hypothetical protein AKJ39_03495 [candidate division MSBL1 archaeon SCGC-AAA259J03]|uniref:Uncharacterized protein n=1 Tax=candidate division MSBL1 archaeon SCGC-AAA259J03 TaxID=1698269 RepID=A0A656YVY4_9EURY|nr:hypothetical protein AKJ39_03495 [candidate division MSBL1 archaeon SCGC-AAA259J03]
MSENGEIDENARKVAVRLQGKRIIKGVVVRDEYGLSDEDLAEALDSVAEEDLEPIDGLWITDEPSEEFLEALGEKELRVIELRASFLRRTNGKTHILIRWARTPPGLTMRSCEGASQRYYKTRKSGGRNKQKRFKE